MMKAVMDKARQDGTDSDKATAFILPLRGDALPHTAKL